VKSAAAALGLVGAAALAAWALVRLMYEIEVTLTSVDEIPWDEWEKEYL
jgi:hypothetical protein